ncbi:MAG: PAS domain-containing protein, partial [Phototrophicaceae bacterium]
MNLSPSEKSQLQQWTKDEASYQKILALLSQKDDADTISVSGRLFEDDGSHTYIINSHLDKIFKNSPLLVQRLDYDGRFLYANTALAQGFGVSTEEIIGKTTEELGVQQPLLDQFASARYTAFATGEEQIIKFSFGTQHYQARIIPEFDPSGVVQTILIIAHNTTHTIQLNHLMREQNDRIRKLEHIAHIGSWELNLTTNELMWSEEFYHIC